MGSTELTVAGEPARTGPAESPRGLIRRPADLVELAELVYRGVFSAGLVVAMMGTTYAAALAALQPADRRLVSVATCLVLVAAEIVALRQRVWIYTALRRSPWLFLVPSLMVGIAVWGMGRHNQQGFYLLTLLLSGLGVAVPLRVAGAGALLAAAGLAAPHIADGSWMVGIAIAAATVPPLFWLIVDQLVRFVLRLHLTTGRETERRPAPVRVRAWVHHQPSPPSGGSDEDQANATVEPQSPATPAGEPLNSRQREVLLLVAEGLQNVEIGCCLGIGAAQVGRHLGNARAAVGVATDAQLMAWAKRHGLLPPEEKCG